MTPEEVAARIVAITKIVEGLQIELRDLHFQLRESIDSSNSDVVE